jgi:DNA-binding MarR family transcriptional regulator
MARQPDSKTNSLDSRTIGPAPPLPFVIGELLEEVVRGIGAAARRRVREAGFDDVRQAHDCVFRFMGPEGARLRDLADRAGMTPQSVGVHVDDLEQLGYVERVPDPADRRSKLIRPTARGTAIMQAAFDGLREMEREWDEAVGARRLSQVRQALEAIRELQAADEQAAASSGTRA